jgi:hypothetical protein
VREHGEDHADADAQRKAGVTKVFRLAVVPCALGGGDCEIAELAVGLRRADPFVDDRIDLRFTGVCGSQQSFQIGRAHDVADPAQFDVLFLHEVFVGVGRVLDIDHAGAPPVRLHPQPFCQRAIVQVFAVPLTATGQHRQQHACAEQQQVEVDHRVL